jgi:hypothetical protein
VGRLIVASAALLIISLIEPDAERLSHTRSITQGLAERLFIRAVKPAQGRGYRLPRQMAVVRTVAKLHQAA